MASQQPTTDFFLVQCDTHFLVLVTFGCQLKVFVEFCGCRLTNYVCIFLNTECTKLSRPICKVNNDLLNKYYLGFLITLLILSIK